MINFLQFLSAHWSELISGTVGVLTGLIAIFLIIPGDQPEKTLQAIVDVLSKFSRKPDGK